jgi:hypothetical protein
MDKLIRRGGIDLGDNSKEKGRRLRAPCVLLVLYFRDAVRARLHFSGPARAAGGARSGASAAPVVSGAQSAAARLAAPDAYAARGGAPRAQPAQPASGGRVASIVIGIYLRLQPYRSRGPRRGAARRQGGLGRAQKRRGSREKRRCWACAEQREVLVRRACHGRW